MIHPSTTRDKNKQKKASERHNYILSSIIGPIPPIQTANIPSPPYSTLHEPSSIRSPTASLDPLRPSASRNCARHHNQLHPARGRNIGRRPGAFLTVFLSFHTRASGLGTAGQTRGRHRLVRLRSFGQCSIRCGPTEPVCMRWVGDFPATGRQ